MLEIFNTSNLGRWGNLNQTLADIGSFLHKYEILLCFAECQ